MSAVQSRPCPPFFHASHERLFRTATELSPEIALLRPPRLPKIALDRRGKVAPLGAAGSHPSAARMVSGVGRVVDAEGRLDDLRRFLQ